MTKPQIAARTPTVVDLEPGEHWWCRCGRSAKQPFCDGSHSGTEFSPLQLKIEKQKRVALCRCKHTGNPPFCDGSHTKLPQ